MTQMKKYLILFSATLLALATIVLPGFIADSNVLEAEIYSVKAKDMNHTVSASGKLQYKAGRPVRVDHAGIFGQSFVRNGDEVSEGDPLFSYYQMDDAYLTLLHSYGGTQGLEALLGGLSGQTDTSALLEQAKQHCTLETVNAPAGGTVNGLSAHGDELLEKDTAVLKLTESRTMEIPVEINESYIEQIHTGQKAEIVFTALPDEHFSGEVTAIADQAEQTNGLTGKDTTVQVTITLTEPENEGLRVGYSASCTIITATDHRVLVLPYEVVRTDDEGDYVYLAKDGKVSLQRITTGTEYKEGIRILEGLREGDSVILNADHTYDGQKLRTEEPHA